VISFNCTRNVLLTDKVGTEEHECIRWSGNIAEGTSFMWWDTTTRTWNIYTF
jgi:hypothetical protein